MLQAGSTLRSDQVAWGFIQSEAALLLILSSQPESNMTMLNGMQMVVAVQKEPSDLWGYTGLSKCTFTLL